MSLVRCAILALVTTGLLASPAAAGATNAIYRHAADREAQRFLREVGPESAIATLPGGPCLKLGRRSAVCSIAVLIRVVVATDGTTEPWRCDAYVVVIHRDGRATSRRTSADCHPSPATPSG
jgi:hypothetical protein